MTGTKIVIMFWNIQFAVTFEPIKICTSFKWQFKEPLKLLAWTQTEE